MAPACQSNHFCKPAKRGLKYVTKISQIVFGFGCVQNCRQVIIFKSIFALQNFQLTHKNNMQFRESSTQHQNFGIEMSQVAYIDIS